MTLHPWHIQTIIVLAFTIIIVLASTLGWALWALLTQMNDPNPNSALTALLGTITGGLAGALGIMAGAFGGIVGMIFSSSNDHPMKEEDSAS